MYSPQDVIDLKRQLAALRADMEQLKAAALLANERAERLEIRVASMSIELTDAHEKANILLFQSHPAIADDMMQIDEILDLDADWRRLPPAS